MKNADRILEDEGLIEPVYRALRRRRGQSATRERISFSAAVVLQLLVLKHIRNWSYETLEREVWALVYRTSRGWAMGRCLTRRRWVDGV